jgi:hypothetical protein
MMNKNSRSLNLKVLTGIRDNIVFDPLQTITLEPIADGAKSCILFTNNSHTQLNSIHSYWILNAKAFPCKMHGSPKKSIDDNSIE